MAGGIQGSSTHWKSISSGNSGKIHASVCVIFEPSPGPQGQIHKETDCPNPLSKHINDALKFNIIISRFNSLQLESKDMTVSERGTSNKMIELNIYVFFFLQTLDTLAISTRSSNNKDTNLKLQ